MEKNRIEYFNAIRVVTNYYYHVNLHNFIRVNVVQV